MTGIANGAKTPFATPSATSQILEICYLKSSMTRESKSTHGDRDKRTRRTVEVIVYLAFAAYALYLIVRWRERLNEQLS